MPSPLIPFWMYPYSWGMKGKTRERAQAEYELTGKHRDLRLLEIERDELSEAEFITREVKLHLKYNDITKQEHDLRLAELIEDDETRQTTIAKLSLSGYELESQLLSIERQYNDLSELDFQQKLLKIQLKNNVIDEPSYLRQLVDLIDDPVKKTVAKLELDLKEGKITENKYNKEKATLYNEPWVNVIDMGFNPLKPEEGSFELDWNDRFVETLAEQGYTGATDDEIVNLWFMIICKNIAMEEFGGVGTFDEDVEANLAAQPATLNGRKVHK